LRWTAVTQRNTEAIAVRASSTAENSKNADRVDGIRS